MLLDARSIAYPDPDVTPSGAHLTRVMAQLGVAEAVRSKSTLRNAIDDLLSEAVQPSVATALAGPYLSNTFVVGGEPGRIECH
jgi:hypothetical protein